MPQEHPTKRIHEIFIQARHREMVMMKFLRHFALNEGGAVTVDFVVLTSAILILAISISPFFHDVTVEKAEGISDTVAAVPVSPN